MFRPGSCTAAKDQAGKERNDTEDDVSLSVLLQVRSNPGILDVITGKVSIELKRKGLNDGKCCARDDDRYLIHIGRLIIDGISGPVPRDDGAGIRNEGLDKEDKTSETTCDEPRMSGWCACFRNLWSLGLYVG